MNDFIIDLVAGILYGAVVSDWGFALEHSGISGEFVNAMRQLHWTIHRIESTFTWWAP